jgi:outer membrane protein, multidrug efflux system
MKLQAIAISIAVGFLTSCTVGSNYHRPAVQLPQAFHAPEPLPDTQAASFADLKWWEVFRDEELQSLIRKALEQNYDLRDAVTRVEAALANLGITRSNQFPQVSTSGDVNFTGFRGTGHFRFLPRSFLRRTETGGRRS